MAYTPSQNMARFLTIKKLPVNDGAQ